MKLKIENVHPAPWKATYILKPDLTLLTESIRQEGILYPLIIQTSTYYIIDGFARWVAAQNAGLTTINVITKDIDDVDAMLLHVEMNRAKGSIVAKDLSELLKRCLRSEKYEPEELRTRLNMTPDEFQVLADGSLVKRRKAKEHVYNKAWVPVETSTSDPVKFERPKTADK